MTKLYPPLTRDHALAFGRIVAAWAYLEDIIAEGIEGFFHTISMEHEGFITAQLDYPKKRDLLRTLSQSFPSEGFEEHFKEIERLNKIRRTIAHSRWTAGRKAVRIKPIGIVKKGGLVIIGIEDNEKEWSAAELNKEAATMMKEAKSLRALLLRLGLTYD